jgi:hypothetical protein
MDRQKRPVLKRLAVDIAGFGLIIAAILTGWLPGPGGIPLFLAGLSILAINYEWARRLQSSVKEKGLTLLDKIFPDNTNIQLAYDAVTFLFAASAILLLRHGRWQLAVGIGGLAVAIAFLNRSRLQRLNQLIARRFGRQK